MSGGLLRRGVSSPASGLVLALAMVLTAGGCASGPEKPKPKPLEPLTPVSVAAPAWTQRIGPVQFPLTVAVAGTALAVASSDGTVASIDLESGRDLWRTSVGSALAAGVGSDGRHAAVVTQSGELVALEGGQVKWRKPVGTRVVTAPLVAGERVFVLGVDRTVQAFDVVDGRRLWGLQRPGDPLTLAQAGALAAFKNTLIVGQGPRLAGVDPLAGTVRWEVPIGAPRGTNEIERLADLIGPPTRIGSLVCARSFQAAVGCVDADRGTLAWTRNVGGTHALAGNPDLVFGADATDRITAWKTGSGEVAWSSDVLLYRGLGAPAVQGGSVVFGDAEGTLHWFSRDKGEAQLRLPTDGSAVAVPPVVAGSLLVVVTRSGGVFAFRSR